MDMIVWIEKPLLLMLHDRQIAEHGGSSGLRDADLLESALARPQQLFAHGEPPPDLAALAACLAHDLAKDHPFVDGNKRAAFVAYRTFLALNHARLEAGADEKYLAIIALADGNLAEADFAAWLRSHLHFDALANDVQEPQARYRANRKSTSRKKASA